MTHGIGFNDVLVEGFRVFWLNSGVALQRRLAFRTENCRTEDAGFIDYKGVIWGYIGVTL